MKFYLDKAMFVIHNQFNVTNIFDSYKKYFYLCHIIIINNNYYLLS